MTNIAPQLILIGAVAVVGVFHTLVPDHWLPITIMARQQAWSKRETVFAAVKAATGHVLSTLLIAALVWFLGVIFAERFGRIVDAVSSLALIGFGSFIALAALRELHAGSSPEEDHHHRRDRHDHGGHRHHGHGHRHAYRPSAGGAPPLRLAPGMTPALGGAASSFLTRHTHSHRHGSVHSHDHEHEADTFHPLNPGIDTAPPAHSHKHKTKARTALLLILGSSPMVEGVPAFFAAAKYGAFLIFIMAAVFAVSTMVTYVSVCVVSVTGLERVRFAVFERYGEVWSGAFIALIGLVFGIWAII